MVMAVVTSMMRAEPCLLQRLRRRKLSGRGGVLEFRSDLLELAGLRGIALSGGGVGLILELRSELRSDLFEKGWILLLDLLEHAQKARGRGDTGRIGGRLALAGGKRVGRCAADGIARLQINREQTGESVDRHDPQEARA